MKNEETELFNITKQIKNVEQGMNGMIIPILKDTIEDGNKHNKRLFILAIIELVIILVTVFAAMFFIYKQNTKYQEFLSQFDFEGTETIYQDTDDNSNINSGIYYNK